ncbi:MAG: hypothetical protein ACI8UO_006525 [Verrucomicrobiales bacterium]|jgi:hypothetical protein
MKTLIPTYLIKFLRSAGVFGAMPDKLKTCRAGAATSNITTHPAI